MIRVNTRSIRIAVLLTFGAVFLSVPFLVGAQEGAPTFTSISGVPGIGGGGADAINTEEFLGNIYRMAIIAAAVIAVIKLILAGAQYVLSGVVTKKENAKRDIRSALIGLLIILAAVTLLTTINPDVTNLPALDNIGDQLRTANEALPPSQIQVMCQNGGCSSFSCENDSTAYEVGCAVRCSEWYGGQVQNNTCLYPNSIADATDRIVAELPSCADGCEVQRCPFWRIEFSCTDWCNNQGGRNIDLGLANTNSCAVPLTP